VPSQLQKLEGGLRKFGKFNVVSEPSRPLVSVITAVYNDKTNLESTIRSVLNQTYKGIEYIIIDGGSTDGTLDIIRKHQDRIAYWMSEPDRGVYDAMNKGADLASGEWINFMNAGDRFFEVETVGKVFIKNQDAVDLIYGDHHMIYDPSFSMVQKAGRLENMWRGMAFCHQSAFVKTSLMKKYKFNIGNTIGADFEFLYTLYLNGFKFQYSNVVIASVLAGGLSDIHSLKRTLEHWFTVRKFSKTGKVDLYYFLFLTNTFFKKVIKGILPSKWVNLIREKQHTAGSDRS
jgi:glycosyltransferase involved in cell wall biosynthesis